MTAITHHALRVRFAIVWFALLTLSACSSTRSASDSSASDSVLTDVTADSSATTDKTAPNDVGLDKTTPDLLGPEVDAASPDGVISDSVDASPLEDAITDAVVSNDADAGSVTIPEVVIESFHPDGNGINVTVWVQNLEVPWSLLFLPDGRALVTERPGRIRLIKDGKLADTEQAPYLAIGDVHASGEGGLMGLEKDPLFEQNGYLYVMYTYQKDGTTYNKVVRLKENVAKTSATVDKVILDEMPGGSNHNGGRIKFGPDGMLYIGAGETFVKELAQDMNSLGGKILRITRDGDIPADNPFADSPIWSLGNRNVQGLTWHPQTNELFASEHGPSGEMGSAHDEVNVITKGKNYGWPLVIGAPGNPSYVDPLWYWPGPAVPPGGLSFYEGDLFLGCLGCKSLIRIKIAKTTEWHVTTIERWFNNTTSGPGKYGRIREVTPGPDGALYITTSNRDGRGEVQVNDDKILRVTYLP